MLSALRPVSTSSPLALAQPPAALAAQRNMAADQSAENSELRKAFDQFVGESLYGQMLKSMRSSQRKPAYFHGGRGEEIFQQQLDQLLAEKMSKTNAGKFTEPMFQLSQLARR